MAELYHAGYEIRVSADGTFYCDELEMSGTSYKSLCQRIDKAGNPKKEYEPVPALWSRSYSEKKMVEVLITSVAQNSPSYRGKEVWISYKSQGETKREKVEIKYLYADTPEARQAFKESVRLDAEAEALHTKANRMITSLPNAKLPKEKSQVNDA